MKAAVAHGPLHLPFTSSLSNKVKLLQVEIEGTDKSLMERWRERKDALVAESLEVRWVF